MEQSGSTPQDTPQVTPQEVKPAKHIPSWRVKAKKDRATMLARMEKMRAAYAAGVASRRAAKAILKEEEARAKKEEARVEKAKEKDSILAAKVAAEDLGVGDGKFQLENFPELFLGFTPYQWQKDVLRAVNLKGCRVALKAANGSGKTSVVAAAAVVWHLLRFPESLVISTAGVYRQVEDQLWPRIRKYVTGLGGPDAGWEVFSNELRFQNGSRAIGFSTNDSGKFEGWHRQGPSENLLMIVDEAKTVPDTIFEAIERCQPSRLLMMSSPGGTEGAFYRAFTKEAHLWQTQTVTAFDCPHLSKEWINEQIDKWGSNHPLVRSMIYGEFMETTGENLVIPYNTLQRTLSSPPEFERGNRAAFCDFAAGGDENVFCLREGNEIKSLVCWRDKDTTAAIGKFIIEFKKAGLSADEIFADAGGMGIPMCDMLRENGWDVHRVNNGERPYNDDQFSNRGSELWFAAARMIEKGEIRMIQDEALFSQLTTRRAKTNLKGKLMVEPKDEMRSRGLNSPDRADAVVGAMCCGIRHGSGLRTGGESIFKLINEQLMNEEHAGELAGAFCGG